MIVRRLAGGRLLKHAWREALVVAIYSVLVVLWYESGGTRIAIPTAVPAILGTALSILMAFRTNSAYGRWWEARKIWGAIVNSSRTFARQVLTMIESPEHDRKEGVSSLQRELVYRQIAWNYALSRSLRRQDPLEDLQSLLPADELARLAQQDNVPNALLQTQAERLRDARRDKRLTEILSSRLDATLAHLTDDMGMCERIKNTVFPTTYEFLVSRLVWLFVLLVSPGLVASLGWVTVPVAFMLGLVFVLIHTLGCLLQDPFENRVSDTPMTTLCRTIERNLRQQLDETALPEKLEPVGGVLM